MAQLGQARLFCLTCTLKMDMFGIYFKAMGKNYGDLKNTITIYGTNLSLGWEISILKRKFTLVKKNPAVSEEQNTIKIMVSKESRV